MAMERGMTNTSEHSAVRRTHQDNQRMSLRSAALVWIGLSILGWMTIVGLSIPVVNWLF